MIEGLPCKGSTVVITEFAVPQNSSLTWLLYKYAALWRAVSGPSATERTLGTIREE